MRRSRARAERSTKKYARLCFPVRGTWSLKKMCEKSLGPALSSANNILHCVFIMSGKCSDIDIVGILR